MSALKGNMSPKIFPPERRFLISLAGAGVPAVIAKSFACIYGRNQPSLGLLGIAMSDDAFFEAVTEGEEITIDVPTRTIVVGGRKNFKFKMAEMEYRVTVSKGISESYKMYGKAIWERLTESDLRIEVGVTRMGRLLISAGSGENRIIGFARDSHTLIAASFRNTRMEDVPYPSLKYGPYIMLQICCRCNCFGHAASCCRGQL
jgi:hypothetical protein